MSACPSRVLVVTPKLGCAAIRVRGELAWLQGPARDELLAAVRAALTWLALRNGGQVVLPPALPRDVPSLVAQLDERAARATPKDAPVLRGAATFLRTTFGDRHVQ